MKAERILAGGILAAVIAVVVVTSLVIGPEAALGRERESLEPDWPPGPFSRPRDIDIGCLGTEDDMPWRCSALPASMQEADFQSVVAVLRSELERYPTGFTERIGLFRIALCDSFVSEALPVGGLADSEQGTIFLVVPSHPEGIRWLPIALHHEVFHFADDADDNRNHSPGVLGEFWAEYETDPARRRELLSEPDSGDLTNRIPGFVTAYSRHDPAEDFAEIFSYLMIQPLALRYFVEHDPVVAAKLALAQETLKRLAPEDPEFWRR